MMNAGMLSRLKILSIRLDIRFKVRASLDELELKSRVKFSIEVKANSQLKLIKSQGTSILIFIVSVKILVKFDIPSFIFFG